MTITKKEALKWMFYTLFYLGRFTEKQFIEYWMKNRKNMKDEMNIIEYSHCLLEAQERKQELIDEVEKNRK